MKHLTTTVITLAIAVLFVTTAAPVKAQSLNLDTSIDASKVNSSFLDPLLFNINGSEFLDNAMRHPLALSLINARSRRMSAGVARARGKWGDTKIPVTVFQKDDWIVRYAPKTPEQRRQIKEELITQQEIWLQEVRTRNASANDIAQILGVTFVLTWEAYSGKPATRIQYYWITRYFQHALAKDAYFQGMTAAEKQYLAEICILSSTAAVRQWREGLNLKNADMQKSGRMAAGQYLSIWWPTSVESLATTDWGFIDRPKAKQ